MGLPANFYVPVQRENAPRFRCRICNLPFWELEKFSRHMKNCSDRHEDELHERSLRNQAPDLFDDQNEGDVELREYVRRTGKWYGFDPKA